MLYYNSNLNKIMIKGIEKMRKTGIIIIGILLSVVLMLVTTFISVNNGVIDREEQINSALASIEVEQKRRVDLIPNLVRIVEDYATYESETLSKVIEMRTAASEGGNVENAGSVFKAVAEAYPELKANEQYQKLMDELSLTENKISQVRENYNKQVRSFNKYTRKFPNSLILSLTGYESPKYEYLDFNAPEDAPNVNEG